MLVLYEDPEDQIPKIVCRCDNYMAWIQEQRMPLHLHVSRDKNISFDQVCFTSRVQNWIACKSKQCNLFVRLLSGRYLHFTSIYVFESGFAIDSNLSSHIALLKKKFEF